jgi:cytochrome c oxidase assembly factor CtaG/ferredoxin
VPEDFADAVARSWTLPFWPTISVVAAGFLYGRGWRLARVTRPSELPAWRAWCFGSGLLVFWLSLASPLDALGQFLLLAHMTQHLALMSIAPPLLVLGAPTVPLLRGLPRGLIRDDLSVWMTWPPFEKARRLVMHPLFAWIAMNAAFIGWHIPAAYELALRSNGWHEVEHGCFFFTSILFWWFVLEPWPSRSVWPRWTVIFYLLSADMVNTALSAFLVFGGSVVYPTYARVPRLFAISSSSDQAAAGAEMWVLGSLIFLSPLPSLIVKLLSPERPTVIPLRRGLRVAGYRPFDLLNVPLAGRLLRSRYGRITLQALSFFAIGAVIADGLRGTPLSSLNLAGLITWNVIRPLALVALLLAGNFFCMACPFTLPRELARTLGIARFEWPSWLRRKWIALALMLLFFWAYEQFSLWDSPRTTALVLIAYIATAFLVDSVFRGGNFCKYVCPVGQFNFVTSLLSPLELGIKQRDTCNACATQDCIRGNATQRGCELQLYLPNKIGNLDCTLCMDCVKACPSDNIQIAFQLPGRDLVADRNRSSLGRLSARLDIAALSLTVSLSALVNAALMIAPVAATLDRWEQQLPALAGTPGSLLATALLCGTVLLAFLTQTMLLRLLAPGQKTRTVFCRFALAALPLGLAMWAAHLGFHLQTSATSIAPLLQHAYADLAPARHAASPGAMAAMAPGMAWCSPMDRMLIPGSKGLSVLSLQIWTLNLGILASLYAGWRLASQMASRPRARHAMFAIWTLGGAAMYAACVWVCTQPMQMRGMGMG